MKVARCHAAFTEPRLWSAVLAYGFRRMIDVIAGVYEEYAMTIHEKADLSLIHI